MAPETEDTLIARCLSRWPERPDGGVGPGDDCALWPPPPRGWMSVAKVDSVVESRHFLEKDPAPQVGHKALGRCLSDFAAMGASPEHALVTVGFPFDRKAAQAASWLTSCYRGMASLAGEHGVSLAGGEMTGSNQIWLNISLHGRIRASRVALRSGARPGDFLFVTGKLGGSFPRRHLRFKPRVKEGQWLVEFGVRSMMDLSDGLGRDLPRLAAASGCSFAIEPDRLPRHRGCSAEQAINDGEDYELLFALPPRKAKSLMENWPFSLKLTRIGELLTPEMNPVAGGIRLTGWDHTIALT